MCDVAFIDHGAPVIIPMTYGRKGNVLYLHGASSSRIMKLLPVKNSLSLSVTLIDGLVVSRSMFDTSVNYRSVVIFGNAELVKEEEKLKALECISEYILPGRWKEVRDPLPKELKATTILKILIEEAAAKVRSGPPLDNSADLESPVWAGEIPLKLRAGSPIDDPLLKAWQPLPKSVQTILLKYN